jgi:large subunit ribosomal protein L4
VADKEKDAKKATPAASKKAAPAKATTAKAEAPKAAKADTAKAKPAARTAAKAKAPTRRAVARPLTRVVRPAETREERRTREREEEKREGPRPKIEARPLPTAPAGHAPVIKADGTAEGSVELPAAIASPEKRRVVLFQALIASLANARQATTATKNRARVAGGGAKPWRQKGTGRARQGSTRSPLWRHGGVVFGPNGRRYKQRMPEKMRRAAFAQALAAHAANGRVLVVDELRFDGDRPRARDVVDWLAKVGDTGRAVLVTAQPDERVSRASANLKEFDLRTPGTLRLADVLRAETVLVHRPALDALAARATVGGPR